MWSCTGSGNPSQGLQRGASARFADPSRAAPNVDIFWSTTRASRGLRGVLTHATGASDVDFDLSRFSGRVALLIDTDGRQQVVARLWHRVLKMSLTGACALDSDLRITFLTQGLDGSAHAGRVFSELARFLSGRSPGREPVWTTGSLSSRNSLIALDGDGAGASYREIAKVMLGAAYTDAAWRRISPEGYCSPRT